MSDDREPAAGTDVSARDYDALDGAAQARVRASWDERMATLRDELDLTRVFEAVGRAYVELDGRSRVVRRGD